MAVTPRLLAAFFFGFALYVAATPSQAQSLSELIKEIYKSHPSLLALEEQINAANEATAIAKSGYYPKISASLSQTAYHSQNIRPTTTHSTLEPFSASLSLSQSLYDGGASQSSVALYESLTKIARLRRREERQNIALRGASAFFDLLRDREAVRAAKNNLTRVRTQARAASEMSRQGVGTEIDVTRANAQLALAKSALAQQQAKLARSEANFLSLYGQKAGRLLVPKEPDDLPTDIDEIMQIAENEHPSLLVAKEQIRAQDAEWKLALSALMPKASVQLSTSYNTESQSQNTYQSSASAAVQLSFDLYDGGANRARIRQKKSQRQASEYGLDSARRAIREGAMIALASYRASRVYYQASIAEIRAARINLESEKKWLEQGSGSNLRVLDAQQNVYEALVTKANARRDRFVTAVNLLASMGRLDGDRFLTSSR